MLPSIPSSCDNQIMSPDIAECPLGGKTPAGWKPLVYISWLNYLFRVWTSEMRLSFFGQRRTINFNYSIYLLNAYYYVAVFLCVISLILILWGRQCSFHFADKKLKVFKRLALSAFSFTASEWQKQDSDISLTPKLMLLVTMFYFSWNTIKTKGSRRKSTWPVKVIYYYCCCCCCCC